MSNANRDYAIVYDVKNSSLVLSRPLNFYITDKNTSNIFIKLVTRVIVGNGIDQYTDIENASNYVLTMRVIKPNNEVKSLEATQHEPENIFQFDLTEDFKDIPGKYICELTISTIVSSKQELITSDPFSYEVKRSILSNVGEIIETEDNTVEKLLNNLDATKAELSSQIKDKANDKILITQEKILKQVLSNNCVKIQQNDIVYYQAVINNPIGLNYTNVPISLKIKFDKGECLNIKRILVKDENNNIIPFQWEGEKHPNYLFKDTNNLSTYADGSLNGGIIWVMGDLGSTETKVYTIEVYSYDVNNGYIDNIPLTINIDNPVSPKDELSTVSTPSVKFQFDYSTGNYHLRRYWQNDVELTSDSYNAVIFPFIKDTNNNDIDLRTNSDLFDSSKECVGNGIVFKDYIVTNILKAKTSIIITTVYRIFANGYLSIDCRLLSKEGTTDRTIQGFGLKYKNKSGYIYTETNGDLLASKWSATEGILMKLINCHMYLDIINPEQIYNVQLLADNGQTKVGWNSYSDKHLNPNSLFYIKSMFVPFTGNSIGNRKNLVNILMNLPSCHATKYNKSQLENRYFKLCKNLADHLHDYNFSDEFPCLVEYEKFAYTKLNSEIRELYNIDGLVNYVNKLKEKYKNGTTEGFKNAYLNARGIEFIGRDTGVIWFIREQFKLLGKNNTYNELTNIIHNLADFYVWVEEYSGSNGSIKLKYNFIDNMNAEATAMKAIKNSLRIENNTTRLNCYNRIKTRLENSVTYKSVFPYSMDHPLPYNAQFHYHAFTLFEYLESVDFSPSFDVASHINQVVTSSGKIFELGYEYAPQRFGFPHSYTYASYVMYKYGTISSMETACRLMENLLSQCYPAGYHAFPLDGWTKPFDSIDQPIEIQTAYQAIMEKLFND